MVDAETEAELQGLQAGEERRGSNASQAVECCLETMVEQIFALGTGARDENAENAPIYFAPELFSYCVFSVPESNNRTDNFSQSSPNWYRWFIKILNFELKEGVVPALKF